MAESKRKKVLIITYYWPPSGGAGVQRWLKTSKYLREFGWEPMIFTPENPEIPVLDTSLERDIIPGVEILKIPIWEPYSIYKRFVGLKASERINAGLLSEKKRGGFLENLSVWVRGNIFIPDARRFWIRPATRFLISYLKMHKVDAIISTGPPHSMHLIARNLHSKLNLPWLADFRDPWTGIDFYEQLKIGNRADRRHHKLEKKVLTSADCITVVGRKMKDDFDALVPREYHIITNGYDENDIPSPDSNYIPDKFRITHAGSITPTRNPDYLWMALSDIITENPVFAQELEIQLIGKFDYSVVDSLKIMNLSNYLTTVDYLPHDELVSHFYRSSLLLLLINNVTGSKGIVTGKLFEYLASGRPILCIGPPDGDAAAILEETRAGKTVDFSDVLKMKEMILEHYTHFRNENHTGPSDASKKYSRRKLTEQMASLLDAISH